MSSATRQQIQHIIASLDNTYHTVMLKSNREEDLYEKKYAISDWIYCLYANDEKEQNHNQDYKDSLDWLIEQFYESKENIAYWDKNWTIDENSTVYARRFGKFCISKSGELKLVSPEEFISSSDTNHQHKYVDLKIKRIEITNNAWFYFRGNKYLGTAFLTRLYFNFNYDFEKVVSFSRTLCDELNRWFIPFEYKFATRKTERYDKGVLYTSREHYYIVFYIVKKIVSDKKYGDLFCESTLAFTKKTSLKGISFGEEPPVRSSSFGRYRADIMADIYIDYYKNLKNNKKTRGLNHFFHKRLIEAGFSTKDFFRNPHTNYPYDFSLFKKKTISRHNTSACLTDKYLTWALNAGKLICKQAIIIEQNNRVNACWLSIIEDEFQQAEYRLTDNSFDEGRLGIVYFLSKLYSYFPDEYILKDICEIVLSDIVADNVPACTYICQIQQWLKAGAGKPVTKKAQNHLFAKQAAALQDKIDALLHKTNTYSAVRNEAPQPIINKGYAAIGLILLALHENNTDELLTLEASFAEEAFLKLINQTMF